MFRVYINEVRLNVSSITLTFCLFLLYIVVIPLLLGFSPELIRHFHSNIIWIAIVFSFLPERFFQQDFEDGTFELYFLSNCSVRPICISKLLGFWSLKIAGVLCTFPALAFLYQLEQSIHTLLIMILGSFVFTLICAIHSTFTLVVKSSAWNSVQHLTTLPTLLPLIIICTCIQTEYFSILLLLGFGALFFWFFWVFVFVSLQKMLSH